MFAHCKNHNRKYQLHATDIISPETKLTEATKQLQHFLLKEEGEMDKH